MNAAAQRRLTPILGGVAIFFGVLLLVFLAGVGRGTQWGPPRAATPLPPAHDQGLPPPKPLAQFAAVWQQPLFNPDRKPSMRTASGGASLGDMQLTGIILTPSLHMALLHDKSGDREVRVREGDSLPDGSWRLAELKPRSAVFESAGGRTQLDLPAGAPIDMPKAATSSGAPAPTAPVAAALPPGAMVVGPAQGNAMPAAGTANPPASAGTQSDRIQQLREAIQKRRAQQSGRPSEGAH